MTTAPAGASLNGVAVANDGTADRVLAVGSNGSQPFSMHKGPTSWSTPPVPTPTGVVVNSAVLVGVDYLHEGTDGASAWAVGSYFDLYNQPHALTEYWDGSAWTLVPNPAASAYSSSKLTHVWIDASGDVWAAGWGTIVSGGDSPPTGRSTIILRWADYEWIQDTTANLGNGSELLANTTTDPAISLWAAGDYADPAAGQQTLAERIVPPTPVGVTRSYYESQVDIATHTAQGCSAARTPISGLVVLDYGQPWYDTTDGYGTRLIPPDMTATPVFARISDIEAAVGAFAAGYHDCAYNEHQQIIVVAGVNNSYSSHLNSNHGKQWAGMLKDLQATLTPMANQVALAGGIDAEPGNDFDPTYTPTANWVNGFIAGGKANLYNFGSPDTYVCRPTPAPLTPTPVLTARPWAVCDTWNTDQYYDISWGLSPQRIYALPQVYKSLNAGWWYDIARAGVDLHGAEDGVCRADGESEHQLGLQRRVARVVDCAKWRRRTFAVSLACNAHDARFRPAAVTLSKFVVADIIRYAHTEPGLN